MLEQDNEYVIDLKREEGVLNASVKGERVIKRAVFELIALLLILALFFFENGYLMVKEQSFVILIGNIAVMFVLSLLFDNNYRIKGKLTGYESKTYKDAVAELNKTVSSLSDKDVEKISVEAKNFSKSAYDEKLKKILYRVGLTAEEYFSKLSKLTQKELKKEGLKVSETKAVLRCKKVKYKELTVEELLQGQSGKETDGVLSKTEKRLDVEHNVKGATLHLLTAVIFGYFAVGVISDFTLANVGWYLIKVCFLAFRGLKSYFEAYVEVATTVATRIRTQCFYLNYLLKE